MLMCKTFLITWWGYICGQDINWLGPSPGGKQKTKMLSEQFQNAKRMRLASVSASGTPTATNLSFWPLRALGTSKIGFLGEK